MDSQTMQTNDNRLLELINKSPDSMSDQELEAYIRQIRHTGIQRQERKATRKISHMNPKKRTETKAIIALRTKLEARGMSAHKIEETITAMKAAIQ